MKASALCAAWHDRFAGDKSSGGHTVSVHYRRDGATEDAIASLHNTHVRPHTAIGGPNHTRDVVRLADCVGNYEVSDSGKWIRCTWGKLLPKDSRDRSGHEPPSREYVCEVSTTDYAVAIEVAVKGICHSPDRQELCASASDCRTSLLIGCRGVVDYGGLLELDSELLL